MKAWLRRAWDSSKYFFAIVVLLGGAWFVFLKLVAPPPVENTSVLIMVWGSLLLLILAAFPKILDRIKKIKAGDIELELQEAIAKSASENAVSEKDLETQHFFIEKGRLEELENVVASALQNPKRTMIFIVNVYQQRIAPAVLAAYLYFISFLGKSVIVVFISMPRGDRKGLPIPSNSVIGAVGSQQVINRLFLRYPEIFRRLTNLGAEFMQTNVQNNTLNFLKGMVLVRDGGLGEVQYDYQMGKEEVLVLFSDILSNKSISKKLNSNDLTVLKNAVAGDDEFIFIIDDQYVISVVPVCEYTRHFTSRVLASG